MRIIILIVIISTIVSFKTFGQIQLGNSNLIELDYANPIEYEIGGIRASGLKFLDANSIISITGLKVGDRVAIPSEQISNAIKKLWEQGILGDIKVNVSKIQGDYVFLDFELTERPRLSKFKFNGIRKSEADDIRESIRLIRGKVITEAMISNTKNKVSNYFVQKGFRNVEVNVTEQTDFTLPNSVVLEIDVKKNKRVKIDEIIFTGNDSFTSEKLRRKMKDTKTKKLYRVMKSSKLLEGAYTKDKNAITDFYHSKGYRDASIIFDSIFDIDDKVRLSIKIDEGSQYYFGDVTWNGNYLYSSDTLSKILNIKKGEIYNKEILDKKLNFNPNGIDITSLYMDDGYLFFNIVPIELRVDSNRIDLEMRIYEGEQATIRNIIFTGNTVTSDHVIRRELHTLPGQKFSRTDLIRSQRELSQLGYFNPETIGINPKPDPVTGLVDIEYTLEEKPSNQITLSGGWGGFQGVVGTLGLVYTNFSARKIFNFKEYAPLPSGDGQRMSIQAQASGRRYQNYALSFTEPWLGGRRPNSLTVSVNQSIIRTIPFTTEFGGTPQQIGALKILGANVYLGRRLRKPDNYFQLTNSLGFNRYTAEGANAISIVDNEIGTNLYEVAFNTVSFTTSLSRNSIDNPTYPRKGSQFNLSLALTPPISYMSKLPNEEDFVTREDYLKDKYKWIEYHKWNFDFASYTPLSNGGKKRAVLQTKANFGIIGNYNKDVGTGPFERFVLGGTGMAGMGGMGAFLLGQDYIGLRGYQDNSPLLNNFVAGNQFPTGGIAFAKFTSEVRYLISDMPMATIYGLAFFEAGNNFHSYKEINTNKIYRSFGTGVRLFMPMFGGLIGFDFAFPLDGPAATTSSPFRNMETHFSLGAPLR